MNPHEKGPSVAGRLRSCDYAACKALAVTSAGGWDFCAKHAEDDRKLSAAEDPVGEPLTDDLLAPEASGHGTPARAMRHRRDGEKPCAPCLAAESRAKVDREAGRRMTTPTPVPGPSPLARLLEDASGHGNARVRRLGERIEALFDDLRAALAEDREKEAARKEVERLRQQLREAEARLRGKRVAAVERQTSNGMTGGRVEPLLCRKGCGKVSSGPQGRSGHERHCTFVAPTQRDEVEQAAVAS